MSDNTLQYQWIVTIQGGLDKELPDFVAGNILWYPVEGQPKICIGPDVLVAFGRPKGHRLSYLQWEEAGVTPQVIWEVLSRGNTLWEMEQKRMFYQRYGVEEYYVVDPYKERVEGWQRQGDQLVAIPQMNGWQSPKMGIRFGIEGGLRLFHPDGQPFLTFVENAAFADAQRRRAEMQRQRAEKELQRAEEERQRAEEERQRAEEERQRAEEAQRRADEEHQRAEEAQRRAEEEGQRAEDAQQRAELQQRRAEEAEAKAEALAARLRVLGISL